MMPELVIVYAVKESNICVIDIVMNEDGNGGHWNENERYQNIASANPPSLIQSVWYRDKNYLSNHNPISKELFEALYGKIEYP